MIVNAEGIITFQMIERNKKFGMGISIIDEDHKKLRDIINKAIVAKKQNYNSGKTKEVLNKMVEYKHKHFSTEEAYMIKFKFSEYQLHRNELLNFLDSTIASYNDLTMDNYHFINEILEFLKQWLVNNIQGTDTK